MALSNINPRDVALSMRVTRDRVESMESWPAWATANAKSLAPMIQHIPGGDSIIVLGLHGQARARAGDFIVKLAYGPFAVCQTFMAEDGKQYLRVKS